MSLMDMLIERVYRYIRAGAIFDKRAVSEPAKSNACKIKFRLGFEELPSSPLGLRNEKKTMRSHKYIIQEKWDKERG